MWRVLEWVTPIFLSATAVVYLWREEWLVGAFIAACAGFVWGIEATNLMWRHHRAKWVAQGVILAAYQRGFVDGHHAAQYPTVQMPDRSREN